jgi:hypothetical protein
MKQLKRDLQSVLKDLKTVTGKAENVIKKLDKLETTQAKAKSRVTAKAKPESNPPVKKVDKKMATQRIKVVADAKVTVVDAILGAILGSKKGITTSDIMEKTGLNKNQVWNVVNRAKKAGKIKTVQRGVYVNATS